jgi:hypothetical protein
MNEIEKQKWRKLMRLLVKAYYKGKNDISEKEFYKWARELKVNIDVEVKE